MRLTINLHFGGQDSTEAELAITPEQAVVGFDDFIKLISPALALVHHNLQAYMQLCEKGTLNPAKPVIQMERAHG